MGEMAKEVLKPQSDRRPMLEFHGAGITEDAIDAIVGKGPRRLLAGK